MDKTHEGYCVRCKKLVPMRNPIKSKTRNNMGIVKGTCPYCSIKVCRLCGKEKGDG